MAGTRYKIMEFKKTILGNDGWHEDSHPAYFARVSNWITIKHNYHPNKRNPLWYYTMDSYGNHPGDMSFNADEMRLDYFTWRKRNYATEQFWALGNLFYTPVAYYHEDEKESFWLSGVDADNYFNPIYVEFDEYCERVRVYIELNERNWNHVISRQN